MLFPGAMAPAGEPEAGGVRQKVVVMGSLHASDHGERWRLKPRKDRRKQIKVLACLSAGKVVVNAGDPDREGQLLVDEVWNTTLERKDARLLLNATDSASVRRR